MLMNVTEWPLLVPIGGGSNNTSGHDTDELVFEWSELICYQLLGFPVSLLGIIGNIMCIDIWTLKQMQWGTSSTSWYLVALSCSDVLYLLTLNIGVLLPDWKRWESNGSLEPMFNYGDTVARLRSIATPLSDTLVNISIYLVAVFTFERFVAVTYPIRGRLFCTPRRARYVILILIATVTVLHIPVFLEYDPAMIDQGYNKQTWYHIGYNWGVMVLIFAVLPIFMLSFFNSMLIRQVFVSRKQRRSMTMLPKQRRTEGKASEKFTVVTMTVILIVIIFFICHTPAAVILCIYTYKSQFSQLDETALYQWRTAFSAANFLSIINSSINFLLYSIFSAKFRKTCAKKYCGWWCSKPSTSRENRLVPSERPTYNTTTTKITDVENGTELPLLAH